VGTLKENASHHLQPSPLGLPRLANALLHRSSPALRRGLKHSLNSAVLLHV
jgi:hypothetical protein